MKCSVCGEILVAQEEIPALGHTEETIPGKAATCTETGLTDGVKCSVCGEILTAQEVIPALGHAWGNWTKADDEVHTRTCANCNETESEKHTWTETDRKDATTTEDGYVKYSCSECSAEKEEILPAITADVLWAGYEEQAAEIGVDGEANIIYVVAKPGAAKIQIRDSKGGTLTYMRDHASVNDITDITYADAACELWTIERANLLGGEYVAVAKYNNVTGINAILAELGAAFTVDETVYDTTVYSAKIDVIDPELGYFVFDGRTAQTITVVTGVDVQKVQLVSDDGSTMTYNSRNAVVTGETMDGKEVLVWTITRLFGNNTTYNFSINTRSALGLADSGVKLSFKVAPAAPKGQDIVSATAESTEAGKAVFTVVTAAEASKVKFTNTADNGTITIGKTDGRAVVTDNGDGTMTWVITINHIAGEFTYNAQAYVYSPLTGSRYSAPISLSLTVA